MSQTATISLSRPGYLASKPAYWRLAALGGLFAALAGMMRPEIIQWGAPDTFAYQAQPMVLVFAAAMVLPCLAYAQTIGLSGQFGLLVWFTLGTFTFTKDFSYIRLPGTVLFITEVLLANWILFVLVLNPRIRLRFGSTPPRLLAAYLVAGAFELGRSLLAGRPVILALRDTAIAWYALFFLLGVLSGCDFRKIILLGKILFLGAALTSVAAIFYFIHYPQFRYANHITPGGIYATIALGVLLVGLQRGFLKKSGRTYGLAFLLAVGVLLSSARSYYLALGLMLAGAVVLVPKVRRKRRLRASKQMVVAALVLAVAIGALVAVPAGRRFMVANFQSAYRGIWTPTKDPDAASRLAMWVTAIETFRDHPLIGVGYGKIFHFEFVLHGQVRVSDIDTRPHNTFLTVLYEMGLLGFVPLLGILTLFFYRASRYLRGSPVDDALCLFTVLIQIGLIVLGMFNLALETPFYGSIFWLNLGLGFCLIGRESTREKPGAAALSRAW